MLELQPDDVFLHYALAMELVSEQKTEEAAKKLNDIRLTFPDYLPVYYQLGGLLAEAGQTDVAVKVYEQGIALAIRTGEAKTASELRSALEELTF